MDPPYKKNLAEKSIENLLKLGWINKKTLLILEKAKDELLKLDLILIDKRNVILWDSTVDITNEAILLINQVLGKSIKSD